MSVAPAATMQRRDFLRRSAYAAGAAGAAASAPPQPAARGGVEAGGSRRRPPAPRNMPIDHFVVLMMENRSFDHYFGWLPGADGVQQRSYPDPDNGNAPGRNATCLHAGHGPVAGLRPPRPRARLGRRPRAARHRAHEPERRAGRVPGRQQRRVRALLLRRGRARVHPPGRPRVHGVRPVLLLADGLDVAEPLLQVVRQSGGLRNNDPPAATAGNQWETIFDRAISRGLSARYYNSDLPFSAVWGARGATWTRPVANYYTDCAAGTLPNITIVDPPFRDGGGGDGISADEHPLGDVRLGQAFMSDVVHAFIESPCWERGALFIVYDEWGGFFDHVRPPSVPDIRRSSNIDEDFGQMGYRIPAVSVSPFAKRGAVSHQLCGFESIIKLITYRYGLGSLTVRDSRANNVGHTHGVAEARLRAARPARPRPHRVAPLHLRRRRRRWTARSRTPATWRHSRTSPTASASRRAPARRTRVFAKPTRCAKRWSEGRGRPVSRRRTHTPHSPLVPPPVPRVPNAVPALNGKGCASAPRLSFATRRWGSRRRRCAGTSRRGACRAAPAAARAREVGRRLRLRQHALGLAQALLLLGAVDLLRLEAVLDQHERVVAVHLEVALALRVVLHLALAHVQPQVGGRSIASSGVWFASTPISPTSVRVESISTSPANTWPSGVRTSTGKASPRH